MPQSQNGYSQQGSELRAVSRKIVRQLGVLDSACGDLPLTPVQAHALIELSHGAISIKELAVQLNVDKSNASRAATHLVEKGFAETKSNPRDCRSLLAQLTPQGRRLLQKLDRQQNIIFEQILSQLSPDETDQIELALSRYHKAIQRAQLQQDYQIREITADDDLAMANVIREVSAEYGLTADKGYGVADLSLDKLSQEYQSQQARYWVIEKEGEILGGGGIAKLSTNNSEVNNSEVNNDEQVCELQKMYFSQALRGKGFAKRLAFIALKFAREQGYQACYLETTASLNEAVKLYESMGFEHIDSHMGNTGHDACEMPMLLKL
nr:bifunctional helix-turn-helix transcriptional regulator/GNAT family N-acetyltransferase [Shewanella sp. UCD-KL12]